MIFFIKKALAIFFAGLMLALSVSSFDKNYDEATDTDALLNFSVVSDTHIESNNLTTYKVFTRILHDAKYGVGENDALVFLGDQTMNGQDIENMLFHATVKMINPASNYISVTGNHDLSNGEGDYATYSKRFLEYTNGFFDAEIDNTYYYKVINGCYFIILSTEDATVNEMHITQAQLDWLKGVLDEADEAKAPIFLMNHYPINYLEGDNPYLISDLLNDYDNLLYFCGHTHIAWNENSIYTYDGVQCINIPKTTETGYEDYDTGIGAQVEVYEDKVVLKIRDFHEGLWLDEYETSYEIIK